MRIIEKIFFCLPLLIAPLTSWAVIGGDPVPADSALARHTVLFTAKSTRGLHGCTATILDTAHALTAAHCLLGAETNETVLVFAISYSDEAPMRNVSAMQAFSRSPVENDIAVLTFTGGLPEGFTPVRLLTQKHAGRGDTIVQAGYGATDAAGTGRGLLRSVQSVISETNEGRKVFGAGAFGKTICNGDSGGPDFLTSEGELVQIGIHSTGNCENHNTSTDVSYYIDWILSTGAKPRL